MPTWALGLLLLAIVAGLWAVALAYTTIHPIEQEDPWPPNDDTSTSAPES